MKKLLLITCLFLGVDNLNAQHQDKSRFFKNETPVGLVDLSQQITKDGLIKGSKEFWQIVETQEGRDTVALIPILIPKGKAFDVVGQIGTFSIIKIWPLKSQNHGQSLLNYWKANKNLTAENIKQDGLLGKIKGDSIDFTKGHYMLPTSLLLANSTEFENKSNTWNIGILVTPVKLRPFATESGQFDFADGISMGTTFSWTLHHSWRTGFTHNLLLYAGLSSYTADSSKIKEARTDYKISTFSPAVGWMWERKNVQLSLLMGIDFPGGSLQKKWVYRNMPWFGLGIGLSLFKISNNESSGKGENNTAER